MRNKRLEKAFLKINLLTLIPITMFGNGETPISSLGNPIINFITGGVGIAIATLILVCVALGCLYHKFEWKVFGYTVAAIVIVFGASALTNVIVRLVH